MKKLAFFLCFCLMGMMAQAQIISTQVKMTILDKNGNPVEGAKVTLYNNEADYTKNINPIQETQVSDQKGRVTFKKLDTKRYYVRAEKGEMSNQWGADYIEKLIHHRINKVNVIIED
ncbi:carboxypeptidase-like regulatory domain-containing protein [Persicobacter psychrovividus]|uniref:Carboxypeptidase regulatory-like domain-containing protein n=1 Tax=Persicobacter psychrovividus TaxID=387638 RepID=A0ABM7VEL4_9BACT|nr:hypothetical protein PEPS_16710 [Persicobacter psychrovividus]